MRLLAYFGYRVYMELVKFPNADPTPSTNELNHSVLLASPRRPAGMGYCRAVAVTPARNVAMVAMLRK